MILLSEAIDLFFSCENKCLISGLGYILREFHDIIPLNIEVNYPCLFVLWSIEKENPIYL
jgi:hypothetical protein